MYSTKFECLSSKFERNKGKAYLGLVFPASRNFRLPCFRHNVGIVHLTRGVAVLRPFISTKVAEKMHNSSPSGIETDERGELCCG